MVPTPRSPHWLSLCPGQPPAGSSMAIFSHCAGLSLNIISSQTCPYKKDTGPINLQHITLLFCQTHCDLQVSCLFHCVYYRGPSLERQLWEDTVSDVPYSPVSSHISAPCKRARADCWNAFTARMSSVLQQPFT